MNLDMEVSLSHKYCKSARHCSHVTQESRYCGGGGWVVVCMDFGVCGWANGKLGGWNSGYLGG